MKRLALPVSVIALLAAGVLAEWTIPNRDDASSNFQARVDSGDLAMLVQGYRGNGVYTSFAGNMGLQVKAQSTPDMTLQITPGSARVDGKDVINSTGSASVTVTAADANNPRLDLVAVDGAGSFFVIAGTPGSNPKYPAIPADRTILAMVLVLANDTSIADNEITDKRVPIRFSGNDVRNHGAAGSRIIQTGTINTGVSATTLTFDAAHDFVPGQGVLVFGAGVDGGIALPTAPALTKIGSGMGTTWAFSARYSSGFGDWTTAQAASGTIDHAATLDATNYIEVRLTPPANSRCAAIYTDRGTGGTQELVWYGPLIVDDGQTTMLVDYQGDTVDHQDRSRVWRAGAVYQEGDTVVSGSKIYRAVKTWGNGVSDSTVPVFPAGFNVDKADDDGTTTEIEIVWRRDWEFVPPDDSAGEINEWLNTTVSTVTSRTVVELTDSATASVTSSGVYHQDIGAFLGAWNTARDDADGGDIYVGQGDYNLCIGDMATDPNAVDGGNSERTIFLAKLSPAGHDKDTDFDLRRDGTHQSLSWTMSPGASVNVMTGMVPVNNNGGSVGTTSHVFSVALGGTRFSGGAIRWYEIGSGVYQRKANAAADGNRFSVWGSASDQYDLQITDMKVIGFPNCMDGSNGLEWSVDALDRSRLKVARCQIEFGGSRDDRCFGLLHGQCSITDTEVATFRTYAGDVVRWDGGLSAECTLDGVRAYDYHTSGSAGTADIGQFVDGRGGRSHFVVNSFCEGFDEVEFSANHQILSGCELRDCSVLLNGGRKVLITGNSLHGAGEQITIQGTVADQIAITGNVFDDYALDIDTSSGHEGGIPVTGNTFHIDDATFAAVEVVKINNAIGVNYSGNTMSVEVAVTSIGLTVGGTSPQTSVTNNIFRWTATDTQPTWFNANGATVDQLQVVGNDVYYEDGTGTTARLFDATPVTTSYMLVKDNHMVMNTGGNNNRAFRTSPNSGSLVHVIGNFSIFNGSTPDGWELEGAGVTVLENNTLEGIENDAFANSSGSMASGNDIGGAHSILLGTSGSATPNAAVDTYGTEVDVFGAPAGNETSSAIRTNNVSTWQHIEYTTSGVVAETVTVRFTATHNDTTTSTIEKSETTNTTTSLSNSELHSLLNTDVGIRDFTIAIKSSIMSSAASVTGTASGSTR